jgi:hypothetical protein
MLWERSCTINVRCKETLDSEADVRPGRSRRRQRRSRDDRSDQIASRRRRSPKPSISLYTPSIPDSDRGKLLGFRLWKADEQEFLPTIPVDTSSLALWVHECTPKFISDVDQAVEAYEDLCRADIMRADDDIVCAFSSRCSQLTNSGKRAHRLSLMLSTLLSGGH